MRPTPNPLVERYRVTEAGRFSSTTDYGNNGMFLIPERRGKITQYFLCIVSDGQFWEHVSVSLRRGPKNTKDPNLTTVVLQIPSWEQMCNIKDLFWEPEETVVQYHPKHSEYVNAHKYVLHLWMPSRAILPTPPVEFV